jgi:hypothetical protein
MYTFHVTFGALPQIPAFAAQVHERLRGIDGLDLVPGRWLHLTTQDVGFTDEVPAAEITAVAAEARSQLGHLAPPQLTVGPARVMDEGIACLVAPAAALRPLRTGLRAAIAAVRGPTALPDAEEWFPHVSLAYSHAVGPADACHAALAGEDRTAGIEVGSVQLIILGRDQRLYEWVTVADIPLLGTAETEVS